MKQITLQELLEAGSHFGHKAERWHPKASKFIYTEKDGIHIIDLAQTKDGVEKASQFVRDLVADGKEILFVATKRQAKSIVREKALEAHAPFLTEHWIGGFLTNWEAIKKNIEKILNMTQDRDSGAWKKFPKHEQVKLGRYLKRLNTLYEGVLSLKQIPQALFVVDVRKESSAVSEAIRVGIPIVAIVDTNSNPDTISYPIPANDDAVGSIAYITDAISQGYAEGYAARQKELEIVAPDVKEG